VNGCVFSIFLNECAVGDCSRRPDQSHKRPGPIGEICPGRKAISLTIYEHIFLGNDKRLPYELKADILFLYGVAPTISTQLYKAKLSD